MLSDNSKDQGNIHYRLSICFVLAEFDKYNHKQAEEGGKEEVKGQGGMPVMQRRRLPEPARLSLVSLMHMEGND